VAKTKGKAVVDKKNKRMEALVVQYVGIDEIKPNHYNPNRQSEHDFQLLLKSMEEDGFTQPIVCVKITQDDLNTEEALRNAGYEVDDIVIVDGEHRWRASAQLGFEEIPVAFMPEGTPLAQAKIATLRHNRARGSEDFELSAAVLRDLQDLGAIDWAQDSLMLSDEELNRLIEDVPAPEALASEEFGSAWEPVKQGVDADTELSDRRSSATPAAVEAQRKAETELAAAKTEEERQAVRRDMGVARFALTLAGEEAKIVKAVIGKAPAQTVLDLCRAELERAGLTPDAALEQAEADAVPEG
jgi:ParB-like chromosome segregation protein Spo0J